MKPHSPIYKSSASSMKSHDLYGTPCPDSQPLVKVSISVLDTNNNNHELTIVPKAKTSVVNKTIMDRSIFQDPSLNLPSIKSSSGESSLVSYPSSSEVALTRKESSEWEVLGAPTYETVKNFSSKNHVNGEQEESHTKLGVLMSTAISTNDLLSSVLFTTGLTALYAGYYAPLCLFFVCCVLLAFRPIYIELVTAIPLNGGTYNAMIHTSSKLAACAASCLSFLSYASTSVVAAASAASYLKLRWGSVNEIGVMLIILAVFCLLCILGLKESAWLSVIFSSMHLTTMVLLILCSIVYGSTEGWATLKLNYSEPGPPDVGKALIYGFATAMLGITGFETSADFVEQQLPGVYAKTIRNMIVLSTMINPTMSFMSFTVLRTYTVTDENNSANLLSVMADKIAPTIGGGNFLPYLVGIDAVTILCATVLTAYIGVGGLLVTMAKDGLLPSFLVSRNKYTNTYQYVFLSFWVVTSLLVLITAGSITLLGTIFSISFLSVMLLMAIGVVLLKMRRGSLPAKVNAGWFSIVVAISAVSIAIVAAIVNTPTVIPYFLLFFFVLFFFIMLQYSRVSIVLFLLSQFKTFSDEVKTKYSWIEVELSKLLHFVESAPILILTLSCDLKWLNEAVQYVRDNEATRVIKIIHIVNNLESIPDFFLSNTKTLNECYPECRIDASVFEGEFSPEMLNQIAAHFGVSNHFIFIGCPTYSGSSMRFDLAELGGVRIITGCEKHFIAPKVLVSFRDESEIELSSI